MATVTPPSNIGYGTVEGQFLLDINDSADAGTEPDFLAATGTIVFTASVPKVQDATASPNPVTVVRSPITGVLDAQGYLCVRLADGSAGARGVKLVATDDEDLNPTGWTWTVTYKLFGPDSGIQLTAPAKHSIEVPEGETVDLTLVAPVATSTGEAMVVGPAGPPPPLEDYEDFLLDAIAAAFEAQPGVELGYASRDTAFTTAANAEIPLLSVTVVGKGRPVDVEFYCSRLYHSVNGTFMQLRLLRNSIQIQQAADVVPATTAGSSFNPRQRIVLTDGVSYTFTAYVQLGAPGTATVEAQGDRPMWLSVVSR